MKTSITRRNFLKNSTAGLAVASTIKSSLFSSGSAEAQSTPQVFFTKDISTESLTQIYSKISSERTLSGKVAVKLHSGEPGGHHFPDLVLIKDLVQSLKGTIVECKTAYPGKRFDTASHKKAMEDHGFTGIAPVDIMDEGGSVSLPFAKGKNITGYKKR